MRIPPAPGAALSGEISGPSENCAPPSPPPPATQPSAGYLHISPIFPIEHKGMLHHEHSSASRPFERQDSRPLRAASAVVEVAAQPRVITRALQSAR